MLSKSNIQAVGLGILIAALTLLCAMSFLRDIVNASPLLLLLGPQLQRGIIFASAGPVLVGSFCICLCAFWFGSRPGRKQIALTTLILALTFPIFLLSTAPTLENVLLTFSLVAATSLVIIAAAACAHKYSRRWAH